MKFPRRIYERLAPPERPLCSAVRRYALANFRGRDMSGVRRYCFFFRLDCAFLSGGKGVIDIVGSGNSRIYYFGILFRIYYFPRKFILATTNNCTFIGIFLAIPAISVAILAILPNFAIYPE